MRLRYSPEAALTPEPVPSSLRTIAPQPGAVRTRAFKLTEEMASGREPVFRINGEAFPDITRLEAKLGETEIWEVENDSEMDHPSTCTASSSRCSRAAGWRSPATSSSTGSGG